MIGAHLPERVWLVPAIAVGLGGAAAAGNAIFVLVNACSACWQDLVIYGLGLPLAVAAFLAAWFGATPMVMRRALLLAGLVVAVNVYLNVVRGSILAGPGGCEDIAAPDCGSAIGAYGVGWNLAFSIAIVAVCLWGTFARPPRDAAPG